MRYLTLGEVVELHRRVLQAGGGAAGIRDLGALDSAIAQPKATFGGIGGAPRSAEARCWAVIGVILIVIAGHWMISSERANSD